MLSHSFLLYLEQIQEQFIRLSFLSIRSITALLTPVRRTSWRMEQCRWANSAERFKKLARLLAPIIVDVRYHIKEKERASLQGGPPLQLVNKVEQPQTRHGEKGENGAACQAICRLGRFSPPLLRILIFPFGYGALSSLNLWVCQCFRTISVSFAYLSSLTGFGYIFLKTNINHVTFECNHIFNFMLFFSR